MANSGFTLVSGDDVKELFAKKIGSTAGIQAYRSIRYSVKQAASYTKLAASCNELQVDPRSFIDWACNHYYPALPQTPNHLQPLIFSYVAAGKPDLEYDRISILLENMFDRLASRLPDADVIEHLLDSKNEFSCVFVYCVAHRLAMLDRLPAHVVESAKQDLLLKPIYLDKFKELLPKGAA